MTELAPTPSAGSPPDGGPGNDAASGPAHGPPPLAGLADTAGITTLGHLAWIGWVWALVGGVVTAIVVTVGVVPDGELHSSLWEDAAAGWQPWLLVAAGVSTTSTFAPMLVGNGVTRSRLSASVAVAMVALALAGSLFVAAGYLVEGVVFHQNDWTHTLNGDDGTIDGPLIASLFLQHALTLAAYFAAGWLIGIGFYRFDRATAIMRILPSALPAVAVELLLLEGGAGITSATLDGLSGPHLALGAPASAAVIAVAALAASRYTQDLALTE